MEEKEKGEEQVVAPIEGTGIQEAEEGKDAKEVEEVGEKNLRIESREVGAFISWEEDWLNGIASHRDGSNHGALARRKIGGRDALPLCSGGAGAN